DGLSDNRFGLAERFFKNAKAFQKPFDDSRVNGVVKVKVPNMDDFRPLTQPVDSANPLFNSSRIPWQVIIDNHPAELKVDAFRSNFSRNQHSQCVAVLESVYYRLFGFILIAPNQDGW